MKKILLGLFVFLSLVVLSTAQASASTIDHSYRHAYKPVVVMETKEMKARINNHSSMNQNNLVCVEAFNDTTGKKTHLGCLWLSLDAMGGQWWGKEFNAPTYMLAKGSYTVKYTFRSNDGSWHPIMSIWLKTQNGNYRAW